MLSRSTIAVALLLTLTSLVSASSDDDRAKFYQKDKEHCAKLLQVPKDVYEQYERSEYTENHDTYCFVRCVAVLQDQYDDEHGLLVDNLYELTNLGKTKEEFTKLVADCQAENGDEDTQCHCKKAFKPVMCVRKHFREFKKQEAAA